MEAVTNVLARSGFARSVVPFATGLAVGGIFFQLSNRRWGQQLSFQKRKVHRYRLDQELVRGSLLRKKSRKHSSRSIARMNASSKLKRRSSSMLGFWNDKAGCGAAGCFVNYL